MKQKIALLVIVLIIIGGSIYVLEKQKQGPESADNKESEQNNIVFSPPRAGENGAPELVGLTGYINTDESISLEKLRGKVVIVDFWTYTCINCIRTLPHLVEWDRKYRDKGLVIIGVHAPEFDFEKKFENVQAAVKKYGIEYPVVLDNNYKTWRAYNNRHWPHKYVIDATGVIRYDHIGEGKYEETEKKIQELLAERGEEVDMPLSTVEDRTPKKVQTPELYAGYEFNLPRGQNIGNDIGLQKGETVSYTLPERILQNKIYLEGSWTSNPGNLEAAADDAAIVIDFVAGAVNIVATSLVPSEMKVFLQNQYIAEEFAGDDVQISSGRSIVPVSSPLLYNVMRGEHGRYKLKLVVKKGFSFNAFTFG